MASYNIVARYDQTMRFCRTYLLALIACSALLAGCGKNAPTEAPAVTNSTTGSAVAPAIDTDYAGWKTLTGKSGTYSVKVPSTYTAASDSPEEVVKALKATVPKMAESFSAAKKNPALDLFAMDLSPESVKDGFADNVNILVANWAPDDLDIERVGKELVRTMPSRLPMVTEIVELGGVKVFKYRGTMIYASEDGKSLSSDLTGFLVPYMGKTYTISLVTNEGGEAEAAETFEKIFRSLTWK